MAVIVALECAEPDAAVIAAVAERLAMAGPVRQHEQHARRWHRVGEEREVLFRRRIDPVESSTSGTTGSRSAARSVSAFSARNVLGAAHGRVGRLDRRVVVRQREEAPDIRRRPREVRAEGGDAGVDLRDRLALVVVVLDRERAAPHVDERQERRGAPVR
jgi:hypothetical protein